MQKKKISKTTKQDESRKNEHRNGVVNRKEGYSWEGLKSNGNI